MATGWAHSFADPGDFSPWGTRRGIFSSPAWGAFPPGVGQQPSGERCSFPLTSLPGGLNTPGSRGVCTRGSSRDILSAGGHFPPGKKLSYKKNMYSPRAQQNKKLFFNEHGAKQSCGFVFFSFSSLSFFLAPLLADTPSLPTQRYLKPQPTQLTR